MMCLSTHFSWRLLEGWGLHFHLLGSYAWPSSGLSTQGMFYGQHENNLVVSWALFFLSTGVLASPLFSQCAQKDSFYKDPNLIFPLTRPRDTRLHDTLSAKDQFQRIRKTLYMFPKLVHLYLGSCSLCHPWEWDTSVLDSDIIPFTDQWLSLQSFWGRG